ncbi:MAG TPA: hypothetical protein VN863_02845 [Candidatus Dormibacteraeota bacterium]|nr:hypothetical protein [Candidatus Dormibacteraeota bacterium]
MRTLITSGIAALTIGVAACGGTSTTVVPGKTGINLKVTGSNVTPANPKATKGEQVTMTITTDKDEEVHLHGYDIHFDCKADQPLSKTFTADKTGSFEMELEKTSTHLTNFDVTPS